jgi:hypothetical protein
MYRYTPDGILKFAVRIIKILAVGMGAQKDSRSKNLDLRIIKADSEMGWLFAFKPETSR